MWSVKNYITIAMETSGFAVLFWLINKDDRKRLISKALIILIIAGIFTLTGCMNEYSRLFINYCIGIIGGKVIFKKSFRETLINVFIAMSIGLSLQLEIMLTTKFLNTDIFTSESFIENISFNFIFILLCVLVYVFNPIKSYYKYKEELSKKLFFPIILIIYSISLEIYWNKTGNISRASIYIFVLIIGLILFLNIKFMIYNIKLKDKEKIIEMHSMYSPIILNLIDEVRQRQHDFKNHITTIYGLSQTLEENILKREVMEYIEKLNFSFNSVENFIYLDNKAICAILYSKTCEAKDKNIDFICDIKDKKLNLPLKEYEISEVLSNLIDNAFEETLNFESNRKVYLTIDTIKNNPYIEIKNMSRPISSEHIRKIFDKGFSTKAKEGRGYGLYNVKKIANFYNGKIELSYEDGYVIFKVIF
ncbi:GHKL domain-containing protein [Clostridium sp. Marseille-Q2269]|uniref:sensor histidine kinase n=1 Tax=Clostridium sp. Marseille-Q2269 TaxID=2942205 RepID=UPI002073D560|nr:GHKL domain-containing protein [Clostridium sp. Marseille-Q2269]